MPVLALRMLKGASTPSPPSTDVVMKRPMVFSSRMCSLT